VFRLQILPLVLLLGTAPTAQAICRADCVGTVPRDRAAVACHDVQGPALSAVPDEDCPPIGMAEALKPAALRESSAAPAASPGPPVGTPALVSFGAAAPPAACAGRLRPPDRRPLVTTLRI
jgi:hypothetical protein